MIGGGALIQAGMRAVEQEDGPIRFDVTDGIAQVTLSAGDRGNPFDEAFCSRWLALVLELHGRKDARAVLIRAEGRNFSVGGDVRMFASWQEELAGRLRNAAATLHTAMAWFDRLSVPTVAAVQGVAAGGAVALTAACDVVYASECSAFTAAYPGIGFSCDAGSSVFLSRRLGNARAKRFLMENKTLDAAQAHAVGLVDHVVPQADLRAAAESAVRVLAAGPTKALGALRRLFAGEAAAGLEKQLHAEAELLAEVAETQDAAEGIRAFLEKREPKFRGY